MANADDSFSAESLRPFGSGNEFSSGPAADRELPCHGSVSPCLWITAQCEARHGCARI